MIIYTKKCKLQTFKFKNATLFNQHAFRVVCNQSVTKLEILITGGLITTNF